MVLGIRDLIQEKHKCYFKKAFFFSALSDNPDTNDEYKAFLDSK